MSQNQHPRQNNNGPVPVDDQHSSSDDRRRQDQDQNTAASTRTVTLEDLSATIQAQQVQIAQILNMLAQQQALAGGNVAPANPQVPQAYQAYPQQATQRVELPPPPLRVNYQVPPQTDCQIPPQTDCQLDDGGKINQTIRDNGINQGYVLSFILASVSKDCFNNLTAVKVSVPGRSKVFSLNGGYGKEMWETHGFYMGRDPFEEPFNLMIEKASTDKMDDKLACDPIVDSFLVKGLGIPKVYGDTMLVNNGLEEGPGFLGNFSQGILLHEEPDELQSPLQRWSIKGTVKYIDSKHYSVAEGIAAVELTSGSPSGILTTASLSKDTNYNLVFTLGDANDSCVAEFTVFAQAGKTKQNFTRQSNGTGLFKSYSMAFKAESSKTEISIVSFDQRQTSDQLYCGPVIDNIMVQSSSVQLNLKLGITFLSWVLGVVILNIS